MTNEDYDLICHKIKQITNHTKLNSEQIRLITELGKICTRQRSISEMIEGLMTYETKITLQNCFTQLLAMKVGKIYTFKTISQTLRFQKLGET